MCPGLLADVVVARWSDPAKSSWTFCPGENFAPACPPQGPPRVLFYPAAVSSASCANQSVNPRASVYATTDVSSLVAQRSSFCLQRDLGLRKIVSVIAARYRETSSFAGEETDRERERERGVFPGGLLRRIIYADRSCAGVSPPGEFTATANGARARHSPGVNSITNTTLLRAPIFHSGRAKE